MPEEIPGFERDPDLDKLLDQNPMELDEDKRIKLHRYKSHVIKARRDADMSSSSPPWTDAAVYAGIMEGSTESPPSEEEPEETEEAEAAEEEAESEEAPAEEEKEESEEEPAEETGPELSEEEKEAATAEAEEIPGFDLNPELEALLDKDIMDLDKETRIEVQKYKSRKMKAKKKAKDEGGGEPAEKEQKEAAEKKTEKKKEKPEKKSKEPAEIDFEEDPELEELLDEDIMDLDKETRIEVQKYKSRKMKAKQAARKGEQAEEAEEEAAAEVEEEEEEEERGKEAPPAGEEKRHRGERKIKELVGARESGREVSRRGFLSAFGLGTLATAGAIATGAAGAGRFFFPNVLSNPPEQFVAGRPEDYQPNTVSDKYKGQYRVWIVHLGERLIAIQAICTHLGCTPTWLQSQGIFKCPCHGSGYYMNGVNFEGPAPRPMDRVGIRLSPEGFVIVDKSQLFSSNEQPGWDAKAAYIPV